MESKADLKPESSDIISFLKHKKFLTSVVNIIVIATLVHYLCYRKPDEGGLRKEFSQSDHAKLYADDNEEFVKLVNDTYLDEELMEWTAVLPIQGDPKEPGYFGSAVIVPQEKREEAKKRFKENEFDVVASEMLSMNRTLADCRFPECASVQYPKKLPTTSIIIIFHNEAWSTLLRTLWSVYNTSPNELLKEIILVDDYSDRDYLITDLHVYVQTFPVPVVIKRTLKRTGLILARLLGAKYAKGQVLTFLDAHCECNIGWLEPLLARVAENRKVVIAPTIDKISDTDFHYTARKDEYAAFGWDFSFFWALIPERELNRVQGDRTLPFRTPAMAGGLFSIDKEYFYGIGSYDENMRIWGSENIEMSLRLWTCGGMVEQHPCSRVGHVFRTRSPHSFPGGVDHVVQYNAARFIDVWVDDYKKWFYSITPGATKRRSNVTERIQLRKRLKCKSFNWYLENVFPESPLLVKYNRIGSFENLGNPGLCLDSLGHRKADMTVGVSKCHFLSGNQFFMVSEAGEFRRNDLCLEGNEVSEVSKFWICHGKGGKQKWIYDENTKTFQYKDNYCLTLKNDLKVTVQTCDGSPTQQWKHWQPRVNLDNI